MMPADDELVESLVHRWYAEFTEGRDVPLEEVCGDRPDLLPRVRQLAARLRRMEEAARRFDHSTAAHPEPAPPSQLFDVAAVLEHLSPEDRTPDELGRLGRYRVLRPLGCGGMGAVLAAEDSALHRKVAIKLMRPEMTALPVALARFLREARAAAAVTHDNLMPVYEAGEISRSGGSGTPVRVPYLVMPLFAGETLSVRLLRGLLPPRELIRLGRHIALGLSAAHGAGIVHRDLKPSNIWLEDLADADGDLPWRGRIMDFGLALDLREAERLTASGFRVGTLEYMSPEQADDQPVAARSDLFALGVVLYEAGTGVMPFGRHRNVVVMLNAIIDCKPDPAPLRAALPPRVADLILRLLSRRPEDRPATAAEVAAELQAAGRDGPG